MNECLEKLKEAGCEVTPCGSRVTCSPAPKDTDEDWLVYARVDELVSHSVSILSSSGYDWEGYEHYQDAAANTFMSWRNGETNIILSSDCGFVDRHKIATEVCKRLNLLEKKDRILVFTAVLYGELT